VVTAINDTLALLIEMKSKQGTNHENTKDKEIGTLNLVLCL
jgi:hypothetical protein